VGTPVRPVTTFSIVARDLEDPAGGSFGVAVASRYFDVGNVVSWAEAGVGAVATQAFVEPGYGPRALEQIRAGTSARDALAALLAADPGRELRQVAVVDASGGVAAHTGGLAIPFAAHEMGDGWSAQGNMLASPDVCHAIVHSFARVKGDLAERLLAGLEAGERAGGDARGRQAAALLVVRPLSSDEPWRNRVVDLRVEDHAQPLVELRRLLGLRRAADALESAQRLLLLGDSHGARHALAEGIELSRRSDEFLFWGGLLLARMGDEQGAVRHLREALEKNACWAELLDRLPELLRPHASVLERLRR